MNKLLWRCRRGSKELDLLLESFLHRHYPTLTDEDKQAFESLLDESDADLLNWIAGRSVPEKPAYRALLGKLNTLAMDDHAG
jgi:antitoxin CptB